MRELSLFTGAGGGLLGTMLLGWHPVGYVEIDDYCQRVLAARIRDGHLPAAPIFGDVREFVESGAAEQYRGACDVVTGGFPCQPFSVAGKRRGADDERNMWPATAAVLRVVRPRYFFGENVPGLLSSGYFGTVLGDLAEMGFDVRWGVLGADDAGAPHRRKRLWIVATNSERHELWDEPRRSCGARGQGAPEPRDDGASRHVADAGQLGLRGRREDAGREARSEPAGLHTRDAAVAHASLEGLEGIGQGLPRRGGDVADAADDGLSRRGASGSVQERQELSLQEQPRSGGSGGFAGRGSLADSTPDGRFARRARDGAEGARGRESGGGGQLEDVADSFGVRQLQPGGSESDERRRLGHCGNWWRSDPAEDPESGVGRVASGIPARVDRLRALGNSQVPAVVRLAWHLLGES